MQLRSQSDIPVLSLPSIICQRAKARIFPSLSFLICKMGLILAVKRPNEVPAWLLEWTQMFSQVLHMWSLSSFPVPATATHRGAVVCGARRAPYCLGVERESRLVVSDSL